ncbi:hypothetical protein [Rhodococcus pyridinivorans]
MSTVTTALIRIARHPAARAAARCAAGCAAAAAPPPAGGAPASAVYLRWA